MHSGTAHGQDVEASLEDAGMTTWQEVPKGAGDTVDSGAGSL